MLYFNVSSTLLRKNRNKGFLYITYIYADFLNVSVDISELDLSKTLLSSWMDVAAITRNLKHLQILNLS